MIRADGSSVEAAAGDAERAARALGMLRALVFGLWLFKLATISLSDLSFLPGELFDPPLLLTAVPSRWWSWILTVDVLRGIQLLLLTVLTLAAVGVRPYRWLAGVAVALLLFEQALIRGYGASAHGEIVALLAAVALAIWPSADRFSWPARPSLRAASHYSSGILLIAAVGCWTYAATGIFRLAHHGWETLAGSSMGVYAIENSIRYGNGAVADLLINWSWVPSFLQASMVVVTLLEIAAPLALIDRRALRVWLGFVVVFHLLSGALLVLFWESLLVMSATLACLDRAVLSVKHR